MNLKQRLFGLVLFIAFITLLFYISINSILSEEELKVMMEQRERMKNMSRAARMNTRMDVEYQKYSMVVEKLKIKIHRTRKKFLLWNENFHMNKKRKNIEMDVLNHGDQNKCKDLTLLYMVSSELSHTSRRNVIRSTWLNHSHWNAYTQRRNVTFEMLFIVGASNNKTQMDEVRNESKQNGDLLILDLEESFYSLSYKVMIGFQWITENCHGYKFLLKGDDDIFVNFHALMNLLHEPTTPKSHLYVGNTMMIAEVIRNGRYGVSREEYQRDNYPRYNSGGGFVLSSDVVEKIVPHFNWITPLKIDDAFMGGLILKAGVDCKFDARFHMYDDGCVYRDNTIVSHTSDKIVIEPQCAMYLNNEALKSGLKHLDKRV